ncbi:hypothetical protein [Halapricum salinum]|uniref:Uncharacterized protein n=1 Tax=Halapricum salinum TaxID=1457250 RepID=A0A4D6HBX5_9EURY|nr:hypothetical protein [Halapricum salinum]QCC51031.1 hypothetical protein DV733_07135 [Halapricum salinum]
MDDSPADRTPGLESDDETESAAPPSDESVADDSLEAEFEQADETPPLRTRLRKLLLGVSLGAVALALLAALLRRVLGDSEDDAETAADDDPETTASEGAALEQDDLGAVPEQDTPDAEPDMETSDADEEVESVSDLLTADAEGAAAMVGLGFNLLVRALVDDDEADA